MVSSPEPSNVDMLDDRITDAMVDIILQASLK